MTDNPIGRAAKEYRELHGIPYTPTLTQTMTLLASWGAEPFELAPHMAWLRDEWINPDLVMDACTIANADLLRERATDEERENFVDFLPEEYDPFEYGPDKVEETVLSHELETLERVIVALERSVVDASLVGDFRVWGGAQWLREGLWAATATVPRDPGAPSAASSHFAQAFGEIGLRPFEGRPLPWP